MHQLSNNHLVFVPPDLSGIIAFDKSDYSTVFIQSDLRQYPLIVSSKGSLNCDFFSSVPEADTLINDLRLELMNKNIMLETV